MKNISVRRVLSVILLAAMVMSVAVGCKKNSEKGVSAQGEKSFTLAIIDKMGNETSLGLASDKATLGEALTEQGIIEFTDGVVTKVLGIEASFEIDETNWILYENGKYNPHDVMTIELKDGVTYVYVVEEAD